MQVKRQTRISQIDTKRKKIDYSFSWLIDSEDLLEMWNVASNIAENNTRAIIPTMCQPLKIKFIPDATIPIMLAIFTFCFIVLP